MTFDAARAKAADLLQLPSHIEGTNCGNCEHFDKGYCNHEKLRMNVDEHWCCYYWDRPDAPLAKPKEKTKLSIQELKSRLDKLKSEVSRLKK